MKWVIVLLAVLMFGFFCCASDLGDDWDSFEGNNSNPGDNVYTVDDDIDTSSSDVSLSLKSSGGRYYYTKDFYLAIMIVLILIALIVFFFFFFFKKPKNKWEKKKTIK